MELVCEGSGTIETFTDPKGRFSIQLGGGHISSDSFSASSGSPNAAASRTEGPGGGWARRDAGLERCELRAAISVYRSPVIDLGSHNLQAYTDLGTIMLQGPKGLMGDAVSATSYSAPKSARKAFEQANKALHRRKPDLDGAARLLAKAVDVFPDYAAAWGSLGSLALARADAAAARVAFEKSHRADPRYLPPLLPLLRLNAIEQRWEDVLALAAETLKLHSGLTEAYLLAAAAALQLGRVDEAEQATTLGTSNRQPGTFPRLLYFQAEIAAARGRHSEAVAALERYLEEVRDDPDTQVLLAKAAMWRRRAAPPTR